MREAADDLIQGGEPQRRGGGRLREVVVSPGGLDPPRAQSVRPWWGWGGTGEGTGPASPSLWVWEGPHAACPAMSDGAVGSGVVSVAFPRDLFSAGT